MTQEARITLAATPDGARAAAEWVRSAVASADPGDAIMCELAVAEAVNNIVLHDAGTDAFTVVMRVRPRRFAAAICHDGPDAPDAAGPPAAMPDPAAPGGRGLALIDAAMQRVHRRRAGAQRRLLMSRRLTPAPRTTTVEDR